MYVEKTCKECHALHLRQGARRAKKRKANRRAFIKKAHVYYFKRERIKHPPFPGDEDAINALLVQMLKGNKLRNRLLAVDHIVPVEHPEVSGLSVSWNMQVLLSSENAAKGNRVDLEAEALRLLQWAKDRDL